MQRNVAFVDEERDRPILKALPHGTRIAIGREIRRLQNGQRAADLQQWRPLTEFGKGVGELKRGPWRIVLSTVADVLNIWIVCAFRKEAKSGSKMTKKHRTLIEGSLERLHAHLDAPKARLH